MKKRLLSRLAIFMHDACDWLHWVPGYRCQLAEWSHALDARYSLGVWMPLTDDDLIGMP